MAIIYTVNGRIIPTVPVCQWRPIQNSELYTNTLEYSPWQNHIWIIDLMNMEDYEYLDNLRGTPLINIDTTDIDDPNTVKSYSDARMVGIRGTHIGLNMTNVRVEYLIRKDNA